MKIKCSCGCLIPDNTDALPYKARFIRDKDWDKLWDEIDSIIKQNNINRDEICVNVRSKFLNKSRDIYQCYNCHKLLIEKENGDFEEFDSKTDIEKDKNIEYIFEK